MTHEISRVRNTEKVAVVGSISISSNCSSCVY